MSAKKGSPPLISGCGGAGGAPKPGPDFSGREGTPGGAGGTDAGNSGGNSGGNGGGPALGNGGGTEGNAGASSNDPIELVEASFKWPSFFGLLGGTFGTLSPEFPVFGTGGAPKGTGGAAEGRGGAADGNGGACENWGDFGNELESALGTEEELVDLWGRCVGAEGTEIIGICGALGGTTPLRLSLDLSFGIPPANISPNWGAPVGIGGAEKDGADALPLWDTVLPSIAGPDLSTVIAFLRFMPFLISPSKASLPGGILAEGGGERARPPAIGGGGGGGGIGIA